MTRPASMTTIVSASRTVDSRCAITKLVRPARSRAIAPPRTLRAAPGPSRPPGTIVDRYLRQTGLTIHYPLSCGPRACLLPPAGPGGRSPGAVPPGTHAPRSLPLSIDAGQPGVTRQSPELPRSSAEDRSSAQTGRSGPHHARLDQARYKSRITIPSSRRITRKTAADPGSAVDPACPSASDPPRQVLIAGVVRDTGKKVKGSAVPAMKVTVSAAMRARDVSRPRPEHLAGTEAAEASAPKGAWGNGPKADEVRADEADGRGQAGGKGGRSPVFS